MTVTSYFDNIYTLVGLSWMVSVCLFAMWKGGVSERAGAIVFVFLTLGTDLARAVNGQLMPTSILFGSDIVLAACLLFIAVRCNAMWAGFGVICVALSLALHTIQLSDHIVRRWDGVVVYLMLTNVLFYLSLLTLVGGVLGAIWGRMKLRDQQTQAMARRTELARQFAAGKSQDTPDSPWEPIRSLLQ